MTLRRRVNDRSGSSLIEMLIVISLWSVVIGVLAALLGQLLRAGNIARAALEQQDALARLQRQFVDDVRQATAAETPETEEDKEIIRLTFDDDHEVSYLLGERDLRRLERRAGTATSREGFRFAEALQAKIDRPGEGGAIVHMRLTRASVDSFGKSRPLAFFAAPLGADRRFEPPSTGETEP